MSWLGRLFGSRKRLKAAELLAAFYGCCCHACASFSQSENKEVREELQSALKGIDPRDFEIEVQILVLLAALESMSEKPWAAKLGPALIKLVVMRMMSPEVADIDNRIFDSVTQFNSLAELERRVFESFAADQRSSQLLKAVESRIENYRAILAEGWHPASTRLGAYAVRAMGGGQRNVFLETFIWISYQAKRQVFTELISSIETDFDVDRL